MHIQEIVVVVSSRMC